eukprot:scpid4577/ scgid0066/ Myosin-IIIb
MAERDVEYYRSLHNLTELAVLDEHSLQSALRYRYDASLVYTNVGDILIALNPFRPLTIYGPNSQLAYKHHPDGEERRKEVPHIYAVARRVYSDMVALGRDQVCVISGESGAGKTESSKFLIRQIMELSRSATYGSTSLESKIVQVNPLLEAFGNARTTMNNNSSRFGKYLSLLFDKQRGYVVGATVNQYLLEKSRVARQGAGERNFHVFYYMFAGLPEDLLGKVHLKRPSQHRYLAKDAECDAYCRSEECLEGFRCMRDCMDAVEMSMEHAMEVFQLLAGILLIGDLEFGTSETAFVSPSNVKVVDAAKALGLDAPSLCRALTVSTNITRGEIITISYSPEKAADCRDATSKAIYGRLFNFIVSFINGVLASEHPDSAKCNRIGILDIFGFENFQQNSFEQFCINLANEELQNLFNETVFQMEKDELKKEGVKSSSIDYQDNSAILSLFLQKPSGMLSLLDEQSMFPRADDQTFLSKLNETFAKNQVYGAAKGRSEAFLVKHYAGKVTYQVAGFLEKNRDTLPENVLEILKTSQFSLLKTLFLDEALGRASTLVRKREVSLHLNRKHSTRVQGGGHNRRTSKAYVHNAQISTAPAAAGPGGGRAKNGKVTVGGQFRQSLQRLMGKLRNASPHFIRCIKPNRHKMPHDFDQTYVLDQLRYTGVLETVRIRREGYAYRPSFGEFLSVYSQIGHPFNVKVKPVAANCAIVLDRAAVTGWQIGKNKVFLKYYHVDQLRETLQQQHRHAAAVQRFVRGYLARREYRKLKAVGDREARVVSDFCRHVSLSNRNTSATLMALNEQDNNRQREHLRKIEAAAELKAKQDAKQKAKKDKAKKKSKPDRPPQPDWTKSPETSPAKPATPTSSASTPMSAAAAARPSVIYSTPESSGRSSSNEDSEEDIYGIRPSRAPLGAVPVLPMITTRKVTPKSQTSSPLANGRDSPYVMPTSNGMKYVNPSKLGQTGDMYRRPTVAPRDPLKRSPSKLSKMKGAKKQSQAAMSNTFRSPTGFLLRNIKIRQKMAENHPAMQRFREQQKPDPTLLELAMSAPTSSSQSLYHEDRFGASSSGDELDEICTPRIGSPSSSSTESTYQRPYSDGALGDRVALHISAEWFCGLISRAKAEEMLKPHTSGTFLVRTSESRFGYSCSVTWHERIRHFIIETLPGAKVRLLGTQHVHNDLQDFVNYYRDEDLKDGARLLTPHSYKTKPVSELENARRNLAGVAGYQGAAGWGKRRGEGRTGTLKRKASLTVMKGQKPVEPKKKKTGWNWRKR